MGSGRRGLRCGVALPAVVLPAVVALAACRAPSPRPAPHGDEPPPIAHASEEAAYDWHGLLIAPFGSVLKDVPGVLHEVLLFRDDAHAAAEDAECFASDDSAPAFVGRAPDEYLLCFKRDRLTRIQASVQLTAEEAPRVFAAACAAWLKRAGRESTNAQSSEACEGRDGAVRFSGRLAEDGVLSIVLDGAPDT
jgi:hypothetical protein